MRGETKPVILVHGLWMAPFAMWPLARRLQGHGLAPRCFGYPSRRESLAEHAARLDGWLAERFVPGQGLAFVGHSLGGIVLRSLADRNPHWFEGARTVLLGSPNGGSAGARFLMGYRAGRWWLGRAGRELAGDEVSRLPCPPGRVGVLAGTASRVWTDRLLEGPNDGMVRVAETALTGAELRTLPLGHMGLLLRRPAAEATAHFLAHGELGPHGEPLEPLC